MPPILSTSHCEFNGARLCTHARKTIPLALIHPFTEQIVATFIVSTIINLKLADIHSMSFLCASYNGPPSINNNFTCGWFFSLFHFHRTLFCGLAGAYMSPGNIFSNSLFMHSLCSPITHSILNGFQPNLYQHFSHPSSTCHTIFSLK